MKVLFVASEALPFVKIGGLGDVIGALPKTLVKKEVDVRVVIPLYSIICEEMKSSLKFVTSIQIKNSWRTSHCGIFETEYDGVKYYLIDNEQYFKRDKVYGEYDDGERFAFFSRAVLDILPVIDFFPDIIHVNDWHTAILPAYLNIFYRQDSRYSDIRTVLSIHNIEFQGKYDPLILGSIFGLDVKHRSLFLYDGDLNILKGGIESVNKIVTVSESYANEILHPTHSFGLHNILNLKKDKIRGILNGIDTELFDPETDKNIVQNYSKNAISGKAACKSELQKSLALEIDPRRPVIGMVGRLTPQKGMDLIREVMHLIADMDIQFILLGTGYQEYEALMHAWEYNRRDKIRSIISFSNEMASKIYAGADIFLMPSFSEPCGLSQMIAMRYGTVPIVHTVGGLRDTVTPYNPEEKTGVGITFQSYNAYDMLDAIKRALCLYSDKPAWRQLRRNAMSCDFSWGKSADKYIDLYHEILQ